MIQVEKKKRVGEDQITLIEVVQKDMSIKKVTESMISERIEWRKRIHVALTLTNLLRIHS